MNNTYSKIFMQNVDYICACRGITFKELEKALGLSAGYLSRIRKGNKVISLDSAIRVTEFFRLHLKEMIYLGDMLDEERFNDILITAKRRKIKELEAEIEQLRTKEG